MPRTQRGQGLKRRRECEGREGVWCCHDASRDMDENELKMGSPPSRKVWRGHKKVRMGPASLEEGGQVLGSGAAAGARCFKMCVGL